MTERIQPRSLVSTTAGFASRVISWSKGDPSFAPLLVPQLGHMNSLEKVEVKLVSQRNPIVSAGVTRTAEVSEVSNALAQVPPSTPKKGSAITAARPTPVRSTSKYLSTVAAKTLLVGKDSVFALCPLTLVVQAEALINNSRVEDALNLLHAVGKPDTPEKVRGGHVVDQTATQVWYPYCSLTSSATSSRKQLGSLWRKLALMKLASFSFKAVLTQDY